MKAKCKFECICDNVNSSTIDCGNVTNTIPHCGQRDSWDYSDLSKLEGVTGRIIGAAATHPAFISLGVVIIFTVAWYVLSGVILNVYKAMTLEVKNEDLQISFLPRIISHVLFTWCGVSRWFTLPKIKIGLMVGFFMKSYVIEYIDILLDILYLREATGPEVQPYFHTDEYIYMLMAFFVFVGIAKCIITMLLAKMWFTQWYRVEECELILESSFEKTEFEIRSINMIFTCVMEGFG